MQTAKQILDTVKASSMDDAVIKFWENEYEEWTAW
jgi:hypothetical protein